MSDEKSQQQTSTESTVAGAAKAGKKQFPILPRAQLQVVVLMVRQLKQGSLLQNG